MGIVSVVVLAGSVALLIVVALKINEIRREEPDEDIAWGLKLVTAALLFGVLVSGVWVVNNHFVKIETPFDPPAAELPEGPEPVADPEPPVIKAPEERSPVDEAKDEHREALDEFEERAGASRQP